MLVFLIVTISSSVRDMKDETWKTTTANFVAFLSFLCSLNFYRGFWSLQDFYFFPTMSGPNNLALSHLVGFLAMYLAGVSLNLTQASCKDSEAPEFYSVSYWARKQGGCVGDPYAELDEESPLLRGRSSEDLA